jgi:small neutral amino acid transporter SnatA (MarC family)
MDKALILNFAAAILSIVNPFGNLPLSSVAIGVQFILNGLANATVGLINPEVTC